MGIISKYGTIYNPVTSKPIYVGQMKDRNSGFIVGHNGAEMEPQKFGELSRPRYRRGKVRRRY